MPAVTARTLAAPPDHARSGHRLAAKRTVGWMRNSDLALAHNCEIRILENKHRATPPHPLAASGLDQVLASRRHGLATPRPALGREPLDRRGLKRVDGVDDLLHHESRGLVGTAVERMRNAHGVGQRLPAAIESPRVFRRLHCLRGWGHGTTKQVFTRGSGAGCPDAA